MQVWHFQRMYLRYVVYDRNQDKIRSNATKFHLLYRTTCFAPFQVITRFTVLVFKTCRGRDVWFGHLTVEGCRSDDFEPSGSGATCQNCREIAVTSCHTFGRLRVYGVHPYMEQTDIGLYSQPVNMYFALVKGPLVKVILLLLSCVQFSPLEA